MRARAPRRRKGGASPSRLIGCEIKELSDWRGETLARVRKSQRSRPAASRMVEGSVYRAPVFCRRCDAKRVPDGFARHAPLADPPAFNSRRNIQRAAISAEGDKIDEKALRCSPRRRGAEPPVRAAARPVRSRKTKERVRPASRSEAFIILNGIVMRAMNPPPSCLQSTGASRVYPCA